MGAVAGINRGHVEGSGRGFFGLHTDSRTTEGPIDLQGWKEGGRQAGDQASLSSRYTVAVFLWLSERTWLSSHMSVPVCGVIGVNGSPAMLLTEDTHEGASSPSFPQIRCHTHRAHSDVSNMLFAYSGTRGKSTPSTVQR